MQHPLFVMHWATVALCVRISSVMLYVCLQTLHCLTGGLPHSRHVWSLLAERQYVTSWAATICWALKTFSKSLLLLIDNESLWPRLGANIHRQKNKLKTGWKKKTQEQLYSQCDSVIHRMDTSTRLLRCMQFNLQNECQKWGGVQISKLQLQKPVLYRTAKNKG